MVNNMKSLNERVGEAMLSLGKIKFVAAYNPYDEKRLQAAGFLFEGKVEVGDTEYSIYKIQNNNIIETQNPLTLSEDFFYAKPINPQPKSYSPWDEWVYLDKKNHPGANNF